MRSTEASYRHWHSNLRRSVGVASSAHIEPKLVQKVGPPLAHAVTHCATRLASSLVLRRGVFGGSRRTARFSPVLLFRGRARSLLGAGIRVTGCRLHSRVSRSVHARLPWPAGFAAATVRSGQQWCTHARGRCLTLQSTGHAPASRVMPVISNVRHRQVANTNARQSRRSFVALLGQRSAGCTSRFAGEQRAD